ncbi:VWA domain-containing protein [Rossellomorea aquimaris]|uniref:nitric oxide reductase activation protein NorD n=1 Tax=Rossellomorea aquimaris TaxID=189382 RepID=UPI001CD5B0AD|nr:VWA domain-containing protein [Rossellomorea aquimaris]MCA1053953.1 VWA domain-containing protein [Rossellomorea aquimaris]
MERFIQFNDETIDSFLFMEMEDLAKTLAKNGDVELKYGPFSYIDYKQQIVYVSHFWDHRNRADEINGLKSDVYLRTIGNQSETDREAVLNYIEKVKRTGIPKFSKQLFVMGEDLRLEEICKSRRPGTKHAFATRRNLYRQYFQAQLKVNLTKSVFTDSLFNSLFLLLNAQSPLEEAPSINEEIDLAMPFLKSQLTKFYEADSTTTVIKICLEMIDVVDEIVKKDMLNEYFHLPEAVYEKEDHLQETFEDLKRKDPLANQDVLEEESTGDEEVLDEEFRTWHRETEDKGESFLQFDLDQGSQSDLMGEGVREGEDGDQALAMVQGSAKETEREQYKNVKAAEREHEELTGGGENEYGRDNKYAQAFFLSPSVPSAEDQKTYGVYKASIAPLQKKLQKMIEKTLEHKRILPRSDLHFGRLNSKLLRFITDDNPRLFYKKQNPSSEIDAAFSLLVDCSGSMFDKMDQTKLGIALFHESLKSVRVPHEIVGFWEDTNQATKTYQPNYLKPVLDYTTSLKPSSGAEILQLEPEEDNRDGFAIRLMTERILRRNEKQKFLLVFSDGEPAAMEYDQNGIIDTHEAVLDARKQGIEVINVFLSNGPIDEGQRNTIQNIYGNYSILVSDIEELPDVLFPLLRKLLYKSI